MLYFYLQRNNWKLFGYIKCTFYSFSFLERDWTLFIGLSLYPRHVCVWGTGTWPSNQILFGEVCHNFSLNEQARKSIRHSAKQGCLPETGLGRPANPRRTLTKSNWKECWFEKHKNRIHKQPADARRPVGDGTTAPASQRGAVFFVGMGHLEKWLLHTHRRQWGFSHC